MRLLPYAAAIGVPVAVALFAKGAADLSSYYFLGSDISEPVARVYEFLPIWAKAGIGINAAALAIGIGHGAKEIAERNLR